MHRTSKDIRVGNRSTVLQQIISSGSVSRQDISADTGLSSATVTTIVKELLALGIVTDVGFQDSGGGRPRGLIAANPHGGVLVGVDLAATHTGVAVFDTTLTRLAAVHERNSRGGRDAAATVDDIVTGIDAALRRAGQPHDRVLGVGVAVSDRGDHGAAGPSLDMIHDAVRLPAVVADPLHASVMAELWCGAGRGSGDVVVVSLGAEVGVGLAFGGALYRGASDTAGEWGHTRLVIDGRLCRCGRRGCLEAYVGTHGIVRSLHDLEPATPILHPDDHPATIAALCSALRAGDQVAARVVETMARHLGIAIADLINLLNPERIVLSGWVAESLGEALLPDVRAMVTQHALSRPLSVAEITLCRTSGDPISLGAACLALESFLAAPALVR